MIKLKFNNKMYKVIESYEITKSSRQVTFNNIKIDFTNQSISDLPFKYQECSLVEINENNEIIKTKFTGYINTFKLPTMKNKKEFRELEIELLSPMALATRRTATVIGEYNLKNLLRLLVQPLINDGFIIKEINVSDTNVKVNYLIETVESSLNKLSNKYNFWWYIDENKNIYINDINYMLNKKPTIIYDDEHDLKGLINITPTIDATDYCNVVDFTNVRTWQFSYDYIYTHNDKQINMYNRPLFDKNIVIKKDDTIMFNFPIDINLNNVIKSINSNETMQEFNDKKHPLKIECEDINGNDKSFYIKLNEVENQIEFSENINFDENSEEVKDWTLIRDTFFNNLITGVKYNGENNIKNIDSIFSCSALMWTRIKFNNLTEINKIKGKVSNSGQIEKIIDMNEQWKTILELQEIASSYININSSQSDKVEILLDENNHIKIGDVIKINKPDFFINDNYIVTDILETKPNSVYNQYKISLRNSDYLENFIDLFRYKETEKNDDKLYNLLSIDYQEDEIKETYEVVS